MKLNSWINLFLWYNMIVKKNFRKINVDMANVSAVLKSSIKKYLDVGDYNCKTMNVEKGIYRIRISTHNHYLCSGKAVSESFINVKKDDVLLIGDIFHLTNEDFIDVFKEEWDGGANSYGKGVVLSTGGDGSFGVTIELERISAKPINNHKERLKKLNEFKRESEKIKKMTDFVQMNESFDDIEKKADKEFSYKKYGYVYSHLTDSFFKELSLDRMNASSKTINSIMKELKKKRKK